MKKIIILLIVVFLGIFVLRSFGIIGTQETYTDATEPKTDTIETPKKTYIDSPRNTYERQVEAQSIANTLNDPGTYLNRRAATRDDAKQSVKESNKQVEEQNKAVEDFLK
jgi:hypothetical protein